MKPRSLRVLFLVASIACGGGGRSRDNGVTSPPPPPPPTPRQAKWSLVWGDEFDGTAIDPSNWIVQDGAANVNNELEYYTPSDAYLEAGSLVLRSEVRTIGKPSVTLTASSKCNALIGISAWSWYIQSAAS